MTASGRFGSHIENIYNRSSTIVNTLKRVREKFFSPPFTGGEYPAEPGEGGI